MEKQCLKIQKEFKEENDENDDKFRQLRFTGREKKELHDLDDEYEINENWFSHFYDNILKWADLGADKRLFNYK